MEKDVLKHFTMDVQMGVETGILMHVVRLAINRTNVVVQQHVVQDTSPLFLVPFVQKNFNVPVILIAVTQNTVLS